MDEDPASPLSGLPGSVLPDDSDSFFVKEHPLTEPQVRSVTESNI